MRPQSRLTCVVVFGTRFFSVSYNQLTGAVPSSLFALQSLTALHLEVNSFSGVVPTPLVALTNLVYVGNDELLLPFHADSSSWSQAGYGSDASKGPGGLSSI